ncbi:uncharacterized protein K460DRAFT_362604 [Cucurbitaria berberidis CBS 394.84]|uniref:Uncharacterized protein n=1 Tax=Cucurbitaria berberidis CBS 394.84 TaxID=1168544 RepID=A0A9P4GU78_9PLEO|nr:uncharacterized protein K460DRAFT_362604 [Cucurbitaria berberidis CBS 394.84]KAF1851850.1 hypothetical protein K460DRAFT_362604 [Cucurbitaria berberidis CBS 394.84]
MSCLTQWFQPPFYTALSTSPAFLGIIASSLLLPNTHLAINTLWCHIASRLEY